MDKEYMEQCMPGLTMIFLDKISKMKGVDLSKIDRDLVQRIAQKAAYNFLVMRNSISEENQEAYMVDEFELENMSVDDNWQIGEMQLRSESFLVDVNVSRFLAEDLGDLSFQLTTETDLGERIVATEDKNGSFVSVRGRDGKEVQLREGKFYYQDDNNNFLQYDEVPFEDIQEIIGAFRTGKFERDLDTAIPKLEAKSAFEDCLEDDQTRTAEVQEANKIVRDVKENGLDGKENPEDERID